MKSLALVSVVASALVLVCEHPASARLFESARSRQRTTDLVRARHESAVTLARHLQLADNVVPSQPEGMSVEALRESSAEIESRVFERLKNQPHSATLQELLGANQDLAALGSTPSLFDLSKNLRRVNVALLSLPKAELEGHEVMWAQLAARNLLSRHRSLAPANLSKLLDRFSHADEHVAHTADRNTLTDYLQTYAQIARALELHPEVQPPEIRAAEIRAAEISAAGISVGE